MAVNYTRQEANTVGAINAEFEKIKTALQDALSRSGVTPNAMQDTLDMNSERIVNLLEAVNDTEPAQWGQVQEYIRDLIASGEISDTRIKVRSSFNAAKNADNTGEELVFTKQYDDTTVGVGGGIYARKGTGVAGDTDGGSYFVDTAGNRFELLHNGTVYATQFGVQDSTSDQSLALQAAANFLDPQKSLVIDVLNVGVATPVLFNNGFKSVTAVSGFTALNLLDEARGTEKMLFGVNMDSDGIATNREVGVATVTQDIEFGDRVVNVDSTANLNAGDVVVLGRFTCQVVEIASGTQFLIDRPMPWNQNDPENSLTNFTTVDRCSQPNIGSVFELGTIDGNGTPDNPRYGFGFRCSHCFKFNYGKIYGINIASKVAQDTRCTSLYVYDISGKNFTDTDAGHGYVYRCSDGTDNIADRLEGDRHRHVGDITFGHRCKIKNSRGFFGAKSDFLTHFNGCSWNTFENCELYYGQEGYATLSDGGDNNNQVIGGIVFETRLSARERDTTKFYRVRVYETAGGEDLLVPRDGSVFNFIDCYIDTARPFCNVDRDYTVNMIGGTYINRRNYGMYQSEGTGEAKFNFYNVRIVAELALGRRLPSAKTLFQDCDVTMFRQPLEEDCGDVTVRGGHWEYDDSYTGTQFFTSCAGNNTWTVTKCTLRNVDSFFRNYQSTLGSSGSVYFGDITFEDGNTFNAPNNITWGTRGNVTMPLARTNAGSPENDSVVDIEGVDVVQQVLDGTPTPVVKRYRQAGSWYDQTSSVSVA